MKILLPIQEVNASSSDIPEEAVAYPVPRQQHLVPVVEVVSQAMAVALVERMRQRSQDRMEVLESN